MRTTDENLGSDRPSHGQIRTTDKDINFEVDEWTNFLPWTVHLMDGFRRRTKILILRWTRGRFFYHGPSTSWTDSDAFLQDNYYCGSIIVSKLKSLVYLNFNFTADFEHLKRFSLVKRLKGLFYIGDFLYRDFYIRTFWDTCSLKGK